MTDPSGMAQLVSKLATQGLKYGNKSHRKLTQGRVNAIQVQEQQKRLQTERLKKIQSLPPK